MGERRRGWQAGRGTALTCAALLLTSAALSCSAVLTKVATIDEPNHIVSGWRALWNEDYRQDVANPPLWRMLAALGSPGTTLHPPATGPLTGEVVFPVDHEAAFSTRTLYDTPGTDGGRFVNHGRLMLLPVAVALGAALSGWAYRLGGPVAAVVSCALYAFDPTVIAQASLVKSDLMLGLALVGLAWAAERAGRKLTVPRAAALGGICGVAVQAKFSGLLTGPMLAVLLLSRALGPGPWPAFGRVARTRGARVAAAAIAGCVAAAAVVGVTWAVYRFRYRPAPSAAAAIDMPALYDRVRGVEAAVALDRAATPAEVARQPPSAIVRFARFADDHRLLPQAFSAGLILQYASTERWPGYLDGQVYYTGRVAYFPLAFLYKTPLPELATLAVAAGVGVAAGVRRAGWVGLCLAVPAVLFTASALTTHVNIGLRNLLPLYPFLDLAAGCAAEWAWHRRPTATGVTAAVLLGGQAVSAVTAWPDYLPFFNAAVGGPGPGLAHLADSNLDWGQDVNALADWQRAHPGVPIYADLFLSVDPAFYGAHLRWLWTPDPSGHARRARPDRPSVVAVSATHLQGLYNDAGQRKFLSTVAARPPVAVLHGTIYLFDYRP